MKFWTSRRRRAAGATNDNEQQIATDLAPASKSATSGRPPYLLAYRSSTPFIALTVGLGVLVDLAGYGLVVPVIPFRLAELGYSNINSRTGWLVAAYAGGLIVSSPPIAYIGARIKQRQAPLIVALAFMAGAIVLFMLTESYEALAISRVLQGISGTGIWTLGLAMITDSVPEERVGVVMGWIMIGFSVGQLIGPPVGGVLYERLGYKAPFVFALILVGIDMLLRFLIIEKHVALKWIRSGKVELPGFETPGYVVGSAAATADAVQDESEGEGTAGDGCGSAQKQEMDKNGQDGEGAKADTNTWHALLKMCTTMRPVTLFALTALNGITLGGLLDSGMTLNLADVYGLNSLGAGLCFLGLIVPTLFASPLAGWSCDRYSAKGIATLGVLLSIPAYPLLIIKGPLPLFIFFLVILGTSMSFFLTPVSQDLSVVVSEIKGLPSTYAFGTFNMCYSIGSFVGPIITGQLLEALSVRTGWLAMCLICAGLSAALLPAVVLFVGGPLRADDGALKIFERKTVVKKEKEKEKEQVVENGETREMA